MTQSDVTPLELRDYAVSYGWKLVKDAIKDGLFVLNSPNENYKQLMFPIEADSSNYLNLVEAAVGKISQEHNKSVFKVLEEIRDVNDDVITVRYFSDSKAISSLSFQEAIESIESTKQLILTAASSVVSPVLFHKRLARSEATELIRKTRFRHTQSGSFTLKISCPIQLENAPSFDLFGDVETSKPMSRKAFELINTGALMLLNSIEEDSFDQLYQEQTRIEKPIISYNLCDSLSRLFDDERELPFELKFYWSRAYAKKLLPSTVSPTVKFPYSFKPKLEELKNYFKPEKTETIDTFFGTVESLNGNEGKDGTRSGEVTIALIIESEIVATKLALRPEWYKIAYQSHGTGGGLIKVKGRLTIGKRVNTMDLIESFQIILK